MPVNLKSKRKLKRKGSLTTSKRRKSEAENSDPPSEASFNDPQAGTSHSDPQAGTSNSDLQIAILNNDPQDGTSNRDTHTRISNSGPPARPSCDNLQSRKRKISQSFQERSEPVKQSSTSRMLRPLNNAELGFEEDEDGIIKFDDIVIPAAPTPALSNDVPESRLVITHLNVRNFKSYAGEQVIGPFQKNFTAVVGPNGSGKSNVIDALMFVFGTKAKNIRAKKISALIHKSSAFPDITSCSVAVNFAIIKDANGGLVEKDSRIIVSRVANRDGSSYYEILNKRVQQKEVTRFLRAYGIDLDYNRFLIMQGEIESISLMNPKGQNEHETGMLEYIEDIIGSNRLIEPIKYLVNKVEELVTRVKEKEVELSLVEKEKLELEGPMKKAVSFLRLENKLILNEYSLYNFHKMKIEEELKDIIENKDKSDERMKSIKDEMEKILAGRKLLEKENTKMKNEYNVLLQKLEDCKEEFKGLEKQDAANLMNIKHAKGKVQALEKSLVEGNKELDKLKTQIAVYESETEELLLKKKKLEVEKDTEELKATDVMSSLKQETALIQEKKDKLESELIKLKGNMFQVKSEMDLVKSELNIYVSEQKEETEKLDNLVSNHKKSTEHVKNEMNLLQEEDKKVNKLEGELVSLKEQLSDAKKSVAFLNQQLRTDHLKLEEARISQQSFKSSNSVLKGLLKEKSSGRIPGIYGRLGDLGAIDEKYDVAISTACGRLDNIVVDSFITAQECVKFLKRTDLGYATFIALDQMDQWETYVHRKISTPENVPRLFDLIQVKDKSLLTAFYFGLGNTLVGNDLEQATRIGLQGRERHRVVTLKGELIDLAGTMSGGGGRVSKGRMGQTVVDNTCSDADFARMSSELDTWRRKLSEVKRLSDNLEDQITRKTSELQSLKHSLRKRLLHSEADRDNVNVLVSQIAEQKKKVDGLSIDKKKIDSLEKEIKVKSKSYEAAVKETTSVEKNISELQQNIVQISKGKFSTAKKTVDQTKKKLDEVTLAITKSSVNLKQSKTKIKKLESKLQAMQTELDSIKNSLIELREKREILTAKGTKATELISEYQTELSTFKEKQALVKKEIDEINEKEHQLKKEEIEHKNIHKELEASESEKRASHRGIVAKIAKLKLNVVEDDSVDLPDLSKEELSQLNVKNIRSEIDVIKVQLEDMKPDLSAIKEYQKKEKQYDQKKAEVEGVEKLKKVEHRRQIELQRRRLGEFMKGFAIIAYKLKEIYQMLTIGGDAELELVDSNDPFLKGIEFSVRPPKKSWKLMRNLSGGEKTLSSLALVFALHYYRPTPFYVMDEIDAALDVNNVAIVAYFLKEQTKNAQFIIVSLRNVMNEIVDHLLGIYKVCNCTKNLKMFDAEEWCTIEMHCS